MLFILLFILVLASCSPLSVMIWLLMNFILIWFSPLLVSLPFLGFGADDFSELFLGAILAGMS